MILRMLLLGDEMDNYTDGGRRSGSGGGGGGGGSGGEDEPGNVYGSYDMAERFNPSMAIIVVVLLSAFFFMGFFSIYARRCATGGASGAGNRRSGRARSRRGGGGRGLDPALIATFPMERYSLKKTANNNKKQQIQCTCTDCVVCLAEFQDDDHVRVLPACGHSFHVSCIDAWLSSHTTCPLCRRSLVLSLPVPVPTSPAAFHAPSAGAAPPAVGIVVDNPPASSSASASAVDSPIFGVVDHCRHGIAAGAPGRHRYDCDRDSFRRCRSVGPSGTALMASPRAGFRRCSSAGVATRFLEGGDDHDHDYDYAYDDVFEQCGAYSERLSLLLSPDLAAVASVASPCPGMVGVGVGRNYMRGGFTYTWFRPR